ncbi:hypothetical protein CGEO_1673 [Campylobacter geochelonis]|nr:hypothetical protein CGEO_1673 [Campylobacter geochelonis]
MLEAFKIKLAKFIKLSISLQAKHLKIYKQKTCFKKDKRKKAIKTSILTMINFHL